MIDLTAKIASVLKSIAPVELAWPEATFKPPLITITEVENAVNLVLQGNERLSDITFQIDVWCKDVKSVQEMSALVSERLTALGFIRGSSMIIPDPSHIARKTMRFRALVDCANNHVYQ